MVLNLLKVEVGAVSAVDRCDTQVPAFVEAVPLAVVVSLVLLTPFPPLL